MTPPTTTTNTAVTPVMSGVRATKRGARAGEHSASWVIRRPQTTVDQKRVLSPCRCAAYSGERERERDEDDASTRKSGNRFSSSFRGADRQTDSPLRFIHRSAHAFVLLILRTRGETMGDILSNVWWVDPLL